MVEPATIGHHGMIEAHGIGLRHAYRVSLIPHSGARPRHLYPLRVLRVHLRSSSSRREDHLPINDSQSLNSYMLAIEDDYATIMMLLVTNNPPFGVTDDDVIDLRVVSPIQREDLD